MPGITGVIRASHRLENADELEAMLGCMRHKPSYRSGELNATKLAACVGWVCQKGTFSDCMPVWNESRDICLILTGEEFTNRDEINHLHEHGHLFNEGNASYLVHLYEELGPRFFQKLNGAFAGLLIDLRNKKVVLFNDRYGISRIYYHKNDTGFYFSSEAKSLLKLFPNLRTLDPKSLGEFYSCGCVLQDRSLFAGVSLLPPASAWSFSPDGAIARTKYFDFTSWEQQPQLDAASYYEKVMETWRRILPQYFRGDRVALSLTGGVDSRMILAWSPLQTGKLPCYTFGGRYRECADVRISREVARICGQQHVVIPIADEFLSSFPELAEKTVYLSDGTMDVSGSIDLYIQRAASDIAPIRVTGTNGGEILRSLVAFKPVPLLEDIFAPAFRQHIRAAAQTYSQELHCHQLSFTAFKQAPWFMGSKFVLERSEVTLRMPYFDNELVALVYQAPPELKRTNALSLRLIADGNPALAKIGTDRGAALSSILGVTRARRFFNEFTFKAEYAYDYGMPQWLSEIDHVLAPLHLERLFLGRHKFHHFRVFYRDELSSYLKDILLDARALGRPYLCGKVLERMVNGHVKGNRNYTVELHRLLTTELTHRLLLEAN